MIELCEELRKMFLEEQNIAFTEDSVKQQREELVKAKKMLHEQIHPLFYSLWGEVWINNSTIAEPNQTQTLHLWYVSLQGLTYAQIARAINDYVKEDKGRYPPNPLEFRARCQKATDKKEEKTKYALLN